MMLTRILLFINVLTLVAAQNVGRFWHVTDFHYDHTYFTEKLTCNDEVPNPGPYGDYWCDSPWRLVQSTVDFMANKTRELGADFVIWTGDTVGHLSDDKTSLSQNLQILRNVTELLETALPGIPVYASLGNHDFYPNNQAESNVSDIYREVGDMWKDWIRNNSMVQRFEDGGFYSVPAANATKLRILALNTNLYFTSNHLTANMADPAGQFVWIEQQLQNARANSEKVIITGHVPVAPLTRGLVNWFYPAHKIRFADILLSYHDVIVSTHFGHDHQDGFKLIQSSDGSRAVAQYTAPSVTPWRYKISTPAGIVSGDPHNPGVRLVEYDRDTVAHLDYHQYFINLTDSNRGNQANWDKLYSFKSAYDLPDMSVTSLKNLYTRLRDGGGRTYTSRYCRFAVVSRQDTHCTDLMRGEVYCSGLHHDVSQAKQCTQDYMKRLAVDAGSFARPNVYVLMLVSVVFLLKP